MKKEQQQLKKAAKEAGESFANREKETGDKTLAESFGKGTIPKEALGLTDAMVEGIYGQAYRLYNTGRFEDAIQLFRLLIMINATEAKYMLGLAACFHMQKKWRAAIKSYTICSLLDPDSPIPHYHASDCYLKLDDKASAYVSLEMAIKRAGNKEEYKTLKSRAEMSCENLKKEYEEMREGAEK